MSYPKKVYKMTPTKGLVSDLPPYELAPEAWSQVINMQPKNGGMQLARPLDQAYGSLLDSPFHLQNVQAQGQNFWLYWGADTVQAAETSNPHTDLTPGGGLTAVQVQDIMSAQLNGLPVFTNGFDAPHFWTGDLADNFEPLVGWPASTVARGIAAGAYHIFAFDIDGPSGEFPMKVMWSDAAPPGAVPGSWTPTAANEAGDTELAQTPGRVQCMVPLRGSYAFYKTSSMYIADYVQDNRKFVFRPALTQCGALTRKSVVDIGGQHFVVTDGDIVVTDGVGVQSIATDRVRDYLFGQLSQANFERLFVVYHQATSQVWVCFPENGQDYCSRALIWDTQRNVWGTRALTAVRHAAAGIVNDTEASLLWDSITEEWDALNILWNAENYSTATRSLLLASTVLQLVGRSGAFSEGYLERLSLSLGEAERFKFVKRIHVRGEGGTIYIRIGTQMVAGGAVSWSAEMPLALGAAPFVDCGAMGRFHSLSMRVPADSLVTSIGLEAESRGYV